MKKLSIKSVSLILGSMAVTTLHAGVDESIYPEAEVGQKRYVIELPKQNDESQYKVELLPTVKQMANCNTRALAAVIDSHSVKGWGYSYHVINKPIIGPSSLMACPEPAVERDVTVSNDKFLMRYNSKLPLVVYGPENMSMAYRVWQAEEPMAVQP